MGGQIYRQKYREFFQWQIAAQAEVEAAFVWLYPLLSTRRQSQIRQARAARETYKTSDQRLADNERKRLHAQEYRARPEVKARAAAWQRERRRKLKAQAMSE